MSNTESIKSSYFTIPNLDIKFPFTYSEDDPNKEILSLRREFALKIKKQLNIESWEQLYVDYYGGQVKKCPFCNKHYVSTNMIYYVDKTTHQLTLNMNYKSSYLCQFKDCTSTRKIYNPNSIEFVSRAYDLSEEAAREFILSRNNSPFYFHPDKQTEEEYKKSQQHNEQWLIDKFGEEEGKRRWKQRNQNLSCKLSKSGLILNHGEEIAENIYKSKAITLPNMIKKYGEEEGTYRYNNWISKISYTSSNEYKSKAYPPEKFKQHKIKKSRANSYKAILEDKGPEYLQQIMDMRKRVCSTDLKLEKYSPERIQQWKHSLATNTLEHFINKYGQEEGPKQLIIRREKQYQKCCPILLECRKGKKVDSKQAFEFFQKLEKFLFDNLPQLYYYNIYYADGIRTEYRIDYFEGNKLRWFKLDFAIPELHFNVEFNGSYFHALPDMDEEYIITWNNSHPQDSTYDICMQTYYKRIEIVNKLNNFKTIEVFDTYISNDIKLEQQLNKILNEVKSILNENTIEPSRINI